MLKCMGLLVASMSAGAVLLSLGEPGPARAENVAANQRAAFAAIGWIEADPALRPDAWRSIEVRHERATAEALLTAVSREENDHFAIGRSGNLTICPAWHAVRGRGTPDGSIRIRVELQRPETQPTTEQQEVLNKLLSTLRARCGLPADAVIPGPEPDDSAPPSPQRTNS